MKITNVRPLVMGTPWRNLTFVIVETDEGLTGVGEVRMINNTDAVLGYLAEAVPRHVLGQDPFDREKLVHSMRVNDYSRAGEVVMTGIALVEMACWDIVGKALGQPVYRLLGGAVRDKIKAYANGWYTVERTPEEFASAARRVVARGYRARKLDPFGAGFYELERAEKMRSISLVEAVRDAVGPDFEILVEMHGRFNPVTAIEIARELEPLRPGVARGAGAAGEPAARSRRSPTRCVCPSPPASACTPASTAASCSSCRPPTSCRPTSRTSAASPSPKTRRVGRRLLHADGAAQRRRAGLHRGVPSPGCLHAELQDPGALQRLRRSLGQRRRGRLSRKSWTAISACLTGPASA